MTTSARMAGSGNNLSLGTLTGLSGATAYTFAAWCYIDVDLNNFGAFYGTSSVSGPTYSLVTVGADGTSVETGTETTTSNALGPNMSVGTWYFFAWSRGTGGTAIFYYALEAAGSLTATSPVTAATVVGGQTWMIGTDVFNEPINGRVAFARIWTAELSSSELLAEMNSATPVRTSGLWADWPLQANANDASGNARNMSATGTVTYASAGPTFSAPAGLAPRGLILPPSQAVVQASTW